MSAQRIVERLMDLAVLTEPGKRRPCARMPNADYIDAAEGCVEQAQAAAAAEGAQKPYAYREWMILAAMACRRAQYLAELEPKSTGEWR